MNVQNSHSGLVICVTIDRATDMTSFQSHASLQSSTTLHLSEFSSRKKALALLIAVMNIQEIVSYQSI